MPNTERQGKKHKVYLSFGDYDTTEVDATILADTWDYLCVMESEDKDDMSTHTIVDTCSGDEELHIGNAEQRGITGEIYLFRIQDGTATDLYTKLKDAKRNRTIVAIMVLTDAKDSAIANGSIGNYIIKNVTQKNSASDLLKMSLEALPAALSAYSPVVRDIAGY